MHYYYDKYDGLSREHNGSLITQKYDSGKIIRSWSHRFDHIWSTGKDSDSDKPTYFHTTHGNVISLWHGAC